MFNSKLLIVLVGMSIPGIISLIPSLIKLYNQLKQEKRKKKLPSLSVFIIFSLVQTLILLLIASISGVGLSKGVDLHAPFLEELSKGQFTMQLLFQQIHYGIFFGVPGAITFLLIYYGVVGKWLDVQNFEKINGLRNSVGIVGRILYGGVVEEVLFRWGVMTVFLWIGLKFNLQHIFALWASILITGVLFGLCHLPSYLANGCQRSTKFIIAIIGLNLFASIIFGWAYAKYGLCSAIIAHSIFHCVWYPLDKMTLKDRSYIKILN